MGDIEGRKGKGEMMHLFYNLQNKRKNIHQFEEEKAPTKDSIDWRHQIFSHELILSVKISKDITALIYRFDIVLINSKITINQRITMK